MEIEIIVKVKMPIVCRHIYSEGEKLQYDELSFCKKYTVEGYEDYKNIANDINRIKVYEQMNSRIFDVIEDVKNEMKDDSVLKYIDDYLNKIEKTGFHCLD